MDILKCYKILELDHEPSMDEAREAYIDMARVWHPDRFANNPRLRKKAEEKLKEINIAYGEIRSRLSMGSETFRTTRTNRKTRGTSEAIHRNILTIREFTRNLFSGAFSTLRETSLDKISQQIMSSKIDPEGVSNGRNQNNGSISGGGGHVSNGRDQNRNFADIYEEVAKAKREEKRKKRKMR